MLEGDGEVTFWGTVEKYEHPLLKLKDAMIQLPFINFEGTEHQGEESQPIKSYGRIINVTSPNFISAHRQDR